MSRLDKLLWQGIPDRGSNRQVDDLPELCFCEFVAVGEPLDGTKCKVHGNGQHKFKCEMDKCNCSDYRPNVKKQYPNHWPRCMCGHMAQDHN